MTTTAGAQGSFDVHVFKGRNGEWRWSFTTADGKRTKHVDAPPAFADVLAAKAATLALAGEVE